MFKKHCIFVKVLVHKIVRTYSCQKFPQNLFKALHLLNKTSDHIDYSKTLESAYGNLEKILGEGGMKDISKTTQNLMEQQKMLMDNMNQMQPMMKAAEGFIDKVGGGQFGGLLNGILGGGNKK
jgi:hypothetical protein